MSESKSKKRKPSAGSKSKPPPRWQTRPMRNARLVATRCAVLCPFCETPIANDDGESVEVSLGMLERIEGRSVCSTCGSTFRVIARADWVSLVDRLPSNDPIAEHYRGERGRELGSNSAREASVE